MPICRKTDNCFGKLCPALSLGNGMVAREKYKAKWFLSKTVLTIFGLWNSSMCSIAWATVAIGTRHRRQNAGRRAPGGVLRASQCVWWSLPCNFFSFYIPGYLQRLRARQSQQRPPCRPHAWALFLPPPPTRWWRFPAADRFFFWTCLYEFLRKGRGNFLYPQVNII